MTTTTRNPIFSDTLTFLAATPDRAAYLPEATRLIEAYEAATTDEDRYDAQEGLESILFDFRAFDIYERLEALDEGTEEACPGCGAKPGEGYTADCEHPDGCGFYKAEASPGDKLEIARLASIMHSLGSKALAAEDTLREESEGRWPSAEAVEAERAASAAYVAARAAYLAAIDA